MTWTQLLVGLLVVGAVCGAFVVWGAASAWKADRERAKRVRQYGNVDRRHRLRRIKGGNPTFYFCERCGGSRDADRSSLTTDCAGVKLPGTRLQQVIRGHVDYRCGMWVSL